VLESNTATSFQDSDRGEETKELLERRRLGMPVGSWEGVGIGELCGDGAQKRGKNGPADKKCFRLQQKKRKESYFEVLKKSGESSRGRKSLRKITNPQHDESSGRSIILY